MIVTENFKVGERDFIRTYSDSGRYVVRDGVSYSEACDPAEFGRTYTEGDLMSDEERDKAEAYDILMADVVCAGMTPQEKARQLRPLIEKPLFSLMTLNGGK